MEILRCSRGASTPDRPAGPPSHPPTTATPARTHAPKCTWPRGTHPRWLPLNSTRRAACWAWGDEMVGIRVRCISRFAARWRWRGKCVRVVCVRLGDGPAGGRRPMPAFSTRPVPFSNRSQRRIQSRFAVKTPTKGRRPRSQGADKDHNSSGQGTAGDNSGGAGRCTTPPAPRPRPRPSSRIWTRRMIALEPRRRLNLTQERS